MNGLVQKIKAANTEWELNERNRNDWTELNTDDDMDMALKVKSIGCAAFATKSLRLSFW